MSRLILALLALSLSGTAAHAEIVAPDAMIKATVQEVITIAKQDKAIQAGDQARALVVVEEKILPHFDFARMTQLAVGKYWRTASAEQKQTLAREFQSMLLRTYTKAFTGYQNQSVEVKPLKFSAEDTDVTVKTLLTKPGAPAVAINYELRKGVNDWKVYDLSIEGAGLVSAYRGTFAKEIEDGGIDGLIKMLTTKNASGAANNKAASK
ncbi:MAG: MlaC/ttg2D family ABC transporter substrate-binding protein [Gallionella sp.]